MELDGAKYLQNYYSLYMADNIGCLSCEDRAFMCQPIQLKLRKMQHYLGTTRVFGWLKHF